MTSFGCKQLHSGTEFTSVYNKPVPKQFSGKVYGSIRPPNEPGIFALSGYCVIKTCGPPPCVSQSTST